ncbi:MAG: hypothetical protein ACYS1A_15605 [Planctomycetota bacterium]|jgi:hypothetical protein
MSQEKRPGGLTALAVLNFVFAGFGVMGLLGMIALFAFLGKIPTDNMDENARAQIEAMQDMGAPFFILMFALSAVSSVLLLISGIGYLKQKKIMGRVLGSAYGLLTIISSLLTGLLFDPKLGGGFNIGTIIGLIYPLLTLILLNSTFKDDLVN